MSKVTVHKFTLYDIVGDHNLISRRMATKEAIARIGGTPVKGTAVEIQSDQLDPEEKGMTPRDFTPDTGMGF